ncbi:hypothetical protein [Stenotrophomonas humi]|nr:hypothetical protein [Stenotrophomonas humi]
MFLSNSKSPAQKRKRMKFGAWLHKLQTKKRRIARPGFIVDEASMTVIGRAVAPFLPNVRGMRYEKGKLIPRHS